MLGKGIAIGRNKNFYSLFGKKFLNKKLFLSVKRLILILLGEVKLLENMKLSSQMVKKL